MQGDETFRKVLKQRQKHRGLRGSILLFSILALFVFVIAWASIAEIDDVTRADGRIIPNSSVQIIQAPEGGVVQQVQVKEGDLVEIGDMLVEMDGTFVSGHLDQERQRVFALRARAARLESEVNGSDISFLPDVTAFSPGVAASEAALFTARKSVLQAEKDVLLKQIEQQGVAIREAETLLEAATTTRNLVKDQIALIAPLVDRGLEPKTSLLQMQIQLGEWDSRATQARSVMNRERVRLQEVENRLLALDMSFRSAALEELTHVKGELAGLVPSFPALEERVRRLVLRAPARGIINQVFVPNVGSVVGAGQELIEIVPVDETLLVEAFVRPADIAFLYPGQPVNTKITAYDFSRYGAMEGQIRRIGASAVKHPDRDVNVFVVEVITSSELLDADEQAVDIVPGMVAEVEFLSGRKTVLDYIVRPVVRVRDRALRD